MGHVCRCDIYICESVFSKVPMPRAGADKKFWRHRRGSQQSLWKLELTDLLSLSLAGVTMSGYLSWASSLASGGLLPSSAGSATGRSVSCSLPFTSRTCTVCGKFLPLTGCCTGVCTCFWAWYRWVQDKGTVPIILALSLLPQTC